MSAVANDWAGMCFWKRSRAPLPPLLAKLRPDWYRGVSSASLLAITDILDSLLLSKGWRGFLRSMVLSTTGSTYLLVLLLNLFSTEGWLFSTATSLCTNPSNIDFPGLREDLGAGLGGAGCSLTTTTSICRGTASFFGGGMGGFSTTFCTTSMGITLVGVFFCFKSSLSLFISALSMLANRSSSLLPLGMI